MLNNLNFTTMEKKLKKMKLHELQKESLYSKEMQKIVGGATCACASMCTEGVTQEIAISNYMANGNYKKIN